jgi:hypothetical protein
LSLQLQNMEKEQAALKEEVRLHYNLFL